MGGENYGQGSSREHAALCPMYLGVKAVLVKSLARIHKDNLVSYGVLPLLFENKADYDRIEQGDLLEMDALHDRLMERRIILYNRTKDIEVPAILELSDREAIVLQAGGKLTYVRDKNRVARGRSAT